MLHHKRKKIHKLIVLNNKNKQAMGKLHIKRQIEWLNGTFCIAYGNGYKRVFLNSKGINSQIFDATKEQVVAP